MAFVRALLFQLAVAHAVASSTPLVDLGYSQYQGRRLHTGVDEYLGMRYAAPPVADQRFRAPQDPITTQSIQAASEFGPICIGVSQSPSLAVSEDCLFINVFTPSNATRHSKLPVWVYIQGGGYAANSNANYNGTEVIQHSGYGLVFVNFNYRVGALGFLASEHVRQNGHLNVGLRDQRKALDWVQKYIHRFGGDPAQVVIHGASAGAGSVAIHLAAHRGRNDGLFAGAISESPFWPTQRSETEMEFQFDRFVNETGCSGSEDALVCLRSVDLPTIQAANTPSPFPDVSSSPLWYFLPVVDGDLIQKPLDELFEQGSIIAVPLLVGDSTNEGSLFAYNATNRSEMAQFLQNNFPDLVPRQMRQIFDAYPPMPPLPLHAPYFPSTSAAYGDSTFTCPGNHMVGTMARYVAPNQVWNYRYNVQDPSMIAAGLGVSHTLETTAIFGVGSGPGSEETTYAGANAGIVPIVMDYWISFVMNLNPNTLRNTRSPYWASWGEGQRLRLQTNSTAMEKVPPLLQHRCNLWKTIALSRGNQ